MTRAVAFVPDWLMALLSGLGAVTVILGIVAAAVALRARRLTAQRDRLAEDVALLRSALVPALPERIGPAMVSAAYEPGGTDGAADFHDAFALPGGRTAVIVGSVEGGRRLSAARTALARHTLRAHVERGLAPRDALAAADATLFDQLGGDLVRCVVAVYDGATGQLTFACAGHAEPELPDAVAAPLPVGPAPLGSGIPAGRHQAVVALSPGSVAGFLTAGATRVAGSLRPGCAAEDLLAPLLHDPPAADMTVCVLQPVAEAPARAALRIDEIVVRGRDFGELGPLLAAADLPPGAARDAARAAKQLIRRDGCAVVEVARGERADTLAVRAEGDREAEWSLRLDRAGAALRR